MPTLKETIWAIVFVTLVSALMMVAVAQLDSSSWAEGIRAEASAGIEGGAGEGGEGEGEDGFEGMSAPLMFLAVTVGSLLKITLLMGLPGLITIGVRRLNARIRNRPRAGAAPG